MMRRLIKNVSVLTKHYTTTSNMNTSKDVKIKTENEIKKMIVDKREEYIKLMMAKSVECNQLTSEINKLEIKLRASYGFDKDEDLTLFPKIKFKEVEIENPLE